MDPKVNFSHDSTLANLTSLNFLIVPLGLRLTDRPVKRDDLLAVSMQSAAAFLPAGDLNIERTGAPQPT